MKILKKLQRYMGKRKLLLPLSMFLSALSELAGIVPYLLIWMILKSLLEKESLAGNVSLYAWLAAGFAAGGVVIYFAALMSSHLAAFRVESNIRKESVRRIVHMPLGFFDINTSGKIRKVIDGNAGVTHSFIAHQLPDLAGTALAPLLSIVMIFAFDWRMGLVCIVPFAAALSLMGFTMGTKGRNFMQSYMTSLEEMNTEAVEYVRGIPVVKVFQQSIYSFKNFHRSIMNYNKMVTGYTLMWEKPMSAYTVVVNGFVFFLTPVALLMMKSGGDVRSVLADFLLFVLVTPVFSQCIMKTMYIDQALGQAAEAVSRLEKLLDFPELPVPFHAEHIRRYSVAFSNVSFAYPGSAGKAVDGVSFEIPQGKTFALVGQSGGGKTTIARLLPRFWDVTDGKVTIGGTDVRNVAPDELMRNISFVFQNTRLFKTTLRENIKYGRPEATDEDVEKAVDMAMCREIIDRLPDGLDTRIGAEGTYLSGGEQQRIVLARAFLKNAPIVVLDEATAFADPDNEFFIQLAMKELMKGKTVLMIAHRLTSVVDADCILVVKDGRIAEKGTHGQLLGRHGIYSEMWGEYRRSAGWTIKKEDRDNA